MARIKDGKLTVEGQDLGDVPLEWFGSDEHKYYYNFDWPNIEKCYRRSWKEKKARFRSCGRSFPERTAAVLSRIFVKSMRSGMSASAGYRILGTAAQYRKNPGKRSHPGVLSLLTFSLARRHLIRKQLCVKFHGIERVGRDFIVQISIFLHI